ncbi:MAG TPA: hypothetical protein VFL91_33320 [Thermomicrobiales bacterium]|nr:hypothetical protein [Thermomicrobiales bacterium]
MAPFRVLVANEPALYREVLVAAFAQLRPHAEVVAVEPAALDTAVRDRAPHLVICSRLSALVEASAPAWVVLYPGGEDRAVVRVGGRRTETRGLEFPGLLAVLDDAARRAGAASGSFEGGEDGSFTGCRA